LAAGNVPTGIRPRHRQLSRHRVGLVPQFRKTLQSDSTLLPNARCFAIETKWFETFFSSQRAGASQTRRLPVDRQLYGDEFAGLTVSSGSKGKVRWREQQTLVGHLVRQLSPPDGESQQSSSYRSVQSPRSRAARSGKRRVARIRRLAVTGTTRCTGVIHTPSEASEKRS